MLVAVLVCLAVGAVLLIPSLVWLYAIDETGDGRLDSSAAGHRAGSPSSAVADDSLR